MRPETATSRQPQLELKYVVPAARAPFVASWLLGATRPERTFPPALVVTTYFDTPQLDLLEDKLNSDYLKTKVRVRWYAPIDRGPATGPVFVEVKVREGATRAKHRVRLDADPARLGRLPLWNPGWQALLAPLRAELTALPADLAPVLRLSYARYRYVDADGIPLTLDTRIAVEAVNPARLAAPARPDSLPWAIVEYKGHGHVLPARLSPLTRFGARRASFSKYLACYAHVTRQAF